MRACHGGALAGIGMLAAGAALVHSFPVKLAKLIAEAGIQAQ